MAATQPAQNVPPTNGSGNVWRLNGAAHPEVRTQVAELAEHDWAKIVLSPTHMVVATNRGSEGFISSYALADEFPTAPKLALVPATSMSFPSTMTGIELAGRHLLVFSMGGVIGLHDLASKATSEYPTDHGFISTGPLVKDSSVYLISRHHTNGSFLSDFDLTSRTFINQGVLSEWAIRNPPVELGGWLYVVDSNQLHGHVYRIHANTLRPETIFVADHKVVAPLTVDRRRDLLWICDVHGNCSAVDTRGNQIHYLTLSADVRVNQAPLVWVDEIVLFAGRDVYLAQIGQEHIESVANMPAPIAALFPVEPDLLGVLDHTGHLRFMTRNHNYPHSVNLVRRVLYLTEHERITATAYHPQRQQLIVVLSQSGIRIVEFLTLQYPV